MRIIGSGGYGHVYEVRRKTMDRNVYAIKIIKLLDRYACRVQHLYIYETFALLCRTLLRVTEQ